MKNYVKIVKLGSLASDCDGKYPSLYQVALVVGNQSFYVSCNWSSRKEANWYKKMLVSALSTIVYIESNKITETLHETCRGYETRIKRFQTLSKLRQKENR